jgi:hypothetical protein
MLALSLGAASLALAASQGPKGHGHGKGEATQFTAVLTGHHEVPTVHSKGHGTLSLTVNDDNTLSFTLTYSDLNAPAQVAHVHLGQWFAAGGVSFFFCGGAKPPCPPGNTSTPVTVTGTVTPADVLGPTAQGIAAGDLAGIVEEIRAGLTYANVHTTMSPGGEIRGQLYAGHGRGHKRGHGPHH